MTDLPSNQIGPYAIIREIGRGGMGVVYLARDTKLNRDVAIKCLPDELSDDVDRLVRFEREAKLLASLNHTNIATIHGLEEVDGKRYIILEYVEGETLEERLRNGAIPLDEALPIAIQIAEAIEAAHDRGVIHRDLKPANIKFTTDEQVKVLDFGLAKAMDDQPSSIKNIADCPTVLQEASPTLPGVILGTAGYLSPEQARGRPVDKRTDIFSFGCVLYEMLTGLPPFPGETATDSIGATLHKDVNFTHLPYDTPPLVRHVLRRCLERDRNKRLRDIGDARIDLESAASTESEFATSSAPAKGRSSVLRLAIAGLLGAVAVAVIAWTMWPSAEPKEVRRLDLGVPGSDVDAPETPVISPDGNKVVYRQRDRLWVRELSRFDARELVGTKGAIEPFWSPDGLWIGFTQGRRLLKSPADGGRPERIATMPSAMSPAGGGAWLADGTIIFTTGGSELYSVSSGGGRPEVWLQLAPDEVDFHDVAPLPDGRGVVFVAHTKVGPWKIWAADGSKRAEVTEALTARVHDPVYSEPGFIVFQQRAPNAGLWTVPFDVDAFQTMGKPFLVAGDATRASVSSDGTLAYLRNSADQDYVLTWLPLDDATGEPVGEPMSTVGYPEVSPDGSRIVHAGGDDANEIVIYDIASGRRSVIAHGLDGAREPSWSPDGEVIAVSYESGGARRLSFFSADGSGKVGDDLDGEWASFDETWASAAVERSGPEGQGGDIWYVAIDDSNDARPLIATPAHEEWARVSPDGNWLCYRSDASGTQEFYLTRYPSGEGHWQITNGGGGRLEWGPNGDRVYYDRPDDYALMEVTLDLTDGVKLGTPRRLWNRAENGFLSFQGFEVPPPGDRVLGVTYERQGDVAPSIGIVLNWYEEFRKR